MQNTLAKSDARNMHIIAKNKVEKEKINLVYKFIFLKFALSERNL